MIQKVKQPIGGHLWRWVAACVALLFLTGCGGGPPEEILKRISGIWETDAVGYEGAQIEINRKKIIFHAVDDTVAINKIADIRYRLDKTGDLLTIEYRNKYDQKYLLPIYLITTPDGDTLVKKNQPHIIWKKAPGEQ